MRHPSSLGASPALHRPAPRSAPLRARTALAACLGAALGLGAASGGCTQQTLPQLPAALDRPEHVSFFCWDGDLSQVAELGLCAPDAASTRYKLHGVVTQTTTGEVAAIQIVGDDDSPAGVIDTDRRVPGFTFAAVGDVPSGVVTPRSNPAFTYVINRGSGDLHVIETSSFRTGDGASVTAVPGSTGGTFFPPGSRPTDMVLTPDERELVITLPELGEVWFVPVDGGAVGTPVVIALAPDLPEPVDLTAVGAPPVYEYVCDATGLGAGGFDPGVNTIPAIPPREPVSRDVVARPWGLAVDAERGQVLVADRALPLIHVLDVATRAELAPLNVSVPTRDVVITPRVPAAPGGTDRTERYLYAIDDVTQSVLAVDYADPARPSFGAVLTVSLTSPQDRLEIPLPVRAIEVATPRYTEIGDLDYCTTAERLPRQLHGVFLIAGTIDGLVRVFDVFDLDTPCRGVGCAPTANSQDLLVAIGRHRPRIAGFDPNAFVRAPVSLDPPPTWQLANTTAGVAADGTAGDSPPLDPIDCPAELDPVFPAARDTSPRVCGVTDPWAATAQRYQATYEGTVPFTSTTGGNFADDGAAIDVRFDPCTRGVLGAEDVPAAGYLADYPGDVVAITSEVPPSVTDETLQRRCAELLQLTPAGVTTPILLPILQASFDETRGYPGRLTVGDPIDLDATLAEVRQCFPELLQLEVRVRGVYLVQSTRAGFRHPVVTGEGGRCEVDPVRVDALERGRAFPGRRFETREIAFQIQRAPFVGRPTLEMTVGNVPPVLGYDISTDGMNDLPSLITRLSYNDVDQRLYVIEQARRGLIRMNLTLASPIEQVFR